MKQDNLQELGFDANRLARVGEAIERDVEAERCHGVALMVARRGRTVIDLVTGYADRKTGRRLGKDAIFATMYKLAEKHGIRHILSGTNVVTEQVLPPHWIYAKTDHVNIKAIHKQFGKTPLKTYPFMDLRAKKFHQIVSRTKIHSVLDFVDYDKAEVKKLITRELGWRDYGGKHYESIFTRFYQGYILPRKFGIDKRKAHLSNLIFAGQITKQEALEELSRPIYNADQLKADYDFVLKKLGLSAEEFERIMSEPPRAHTDFDYERPLYDRFPLLSPLRRPLRFITRRLSSR